MKKMIFVLTVVILSVFELGKAGAQTISFGIFYNSLAPYGEWVAVGSYGMCWRPEGVPPGWKPYVFGHWVWTPYGWTWVSNDPWGWAVYHYGRWFYDPYYGWLWVPGYVWAPAWVQWRWGNGFIGWAPMPPGLHFKLDVVITGEDDDFGVGMQAWNFIRIDDITSNRYTLLDDKALPRVFGETRNVTRIRFSNDGVYNTSIPREEVERVTRTRIQTVELVRSNQGMHERLNGNKLMIYSPSPFQPRIRNEQLEIHRQNEFIQRLRTQPNGVMQNGRPREPVERRRVIDERGMITPPQFQPRTESVRRRSRVELPQGPKVEQKEETDSGRHRHR